MMLFSCCQTDEINGDFFYRFLYSLSYKMLTVDRICSAKILQIQDMPAEKRNDNITRLVRLILAWLAGRLLEPVRTIGASLVSMKYLIQKNGGKRCNKCHVVRSEV